MMNWDLRLALRMKVELLKDKHPQTVSKRHPKERARRSGSRNRNGLLVSAFKIKMIKLKIKKLISSEFYIFKTPNSKWLKTKSSFLWPKLWLPKAKLDR